MGKLKLFSRGKDGGPDSKVWGYWLIEWKDVISIALLRFEDGSRDAYHSHAFNSASWVLKGLLIEHEQFRPDYTAISHRPSLWPILTRRTTCHRVRSVGRTWVITFRGPWRSWWQEWSGGVNYMLTHGRKVLWHS